MHVTHGSLHVRAADGLFNVSVSDNGVNVIYFELGDVTKGTFFVQHNYV